MWDCTLAAGYKNAAYKKAYGYNHFGVDFDSKAAVDFDALASGNGTVLGTEKNANSIGGVVVIKYPKVFNPTTNKVKDLIVRYYHFEKIEVKKGDKVVPYQVIGKISGKHKWWNHIHFEVDTDTAFPFYTPQVTEAASKLLKRNSLSVAVLSRSIIDPMEVLVVGNKQQAKIHNLAKYVDRIFDNPRYQEGE